MKHSAVGASGSKRWTVCNGSVILGKVSAKRGDTTASIEGTAAHAVAEFMLEWGFAPDFVDVEFREDDGTVRPVRWTVLPEMLKALQEYVDEVQAYQADPDSKVTIERQVSLAPLDDALAEAFGTADCIVVQKDTLIVLDLKFGKGVYVDHINNLQAIFYAIGAYLELDEADRKHISRVRVGIAQPRIGDHTLRYFDLDLGDLLEHAYDLVVGAKGVAAATSAYHGHGVGSPEFKKFIEPGDHCHWCDGRKLCPSRKEKATEKAVTAFAPVVLTDGKTSRILNFST